MREDGHGSVKADKVERLTLRAVVGDGEGGEERELGADDSGARAVEVELEAKARDQVLGESAGARAARARHRCANYSIHCHGAKRNRRSGTVRQSQSRLTTL